jgi:hypothetical protein
MATQKRGSSGSNVSVGEVKFALERSLDGADAARGAALTGLARLRAAKSTGLQREQARLAAKYGAQDQRTLAVAERAAVNQVLVQQVSAEAVRATLEVPAADPRAWILHGRVLDAALAGVPSLTVALYDEKDVWQRALGHACTDKTGYFRLTASSGRTAVDDKTGAKTPAVFIHVLDAKGATLHKDPRPLHPALGRVDFRQIVLGEPPAQCSPPDGGDTPVPKPGPSTQPYTPADPKPNTKDKPAKPRTRRKTG